MGHFGLDEKSAPQPSKRNNTMAGISAIGSSAANTPATSDTKSTSSTGITDTTSLQGLSSDDFLKLMITQLQNQDPLNPTDDNQLLQQVDQIRSIASSEKLSQTLTDVQLGQNLTNATTLIGKTIQGNSDDNQPVNGVVNSVSIVGGVPKIHVGGQTVSLSNVAQVSTGS
jgi:flagellar basal-body rod modification protein FlgD